MSAHYRTGNYVKTRDKPRKAISAFNNTFVCFKFSIKFAFINISLPFYTVVFIFKSVIFFLQCLIFICKAVYFLLFFSVLRFYKPGASFYALVLLFHRIELFASLGQLFYRFACGHQLRSQRLICRLQF